MRPPAGPPPPAVPDDEYARAVQALVRACLDRLAAMPVELEAEPAPTWDPTRG